MSDSERRQAARILTDFSLMLFDEKGGELDSRALAHDEREGVALGRLARLLESQGRPAEARSVAPFPAAEACPALSRRCFSAASATAAGAAVAAAAAGATAAAACR